MTFRNSISPLAAVAAVALSFAGRAEAQTLQSTLVANGFTEPLYVCSPPGDTHRLFVVEHRGTIKIIKDGALLATPFLDLDPIVAGGTGSDERGLLGLVFDPNYATNGFFYVDYTALDGSTVLRQYSVSANPDVGDPSTFTTIFGPYADPQTNHNGGCLHFGQDGMLYVGYGDGGNADDMGTGHDPLVGNAQSMGTYWGKMLRIDVNNPPTYVPAGNPFPSSAIPLTWALGLRNPWRWSFDRQTGDMYIADVGQGAVEEIDFQPAASTGGENYGWRCMEGNTCTGFTGCTCNSPALTMPIQTYTHAVGCAIIGGFMYRGSAIIGFQGNYMYADYCSAKIWSFAYDGTTVSNFVDRTAQLHPTGGLTIGAPTSFGEDANGEMYITDFSGGEVFRIDGTCPPPTNYCTSTTNSSGVPSVMGFAGNGSISNNDLLLQSFGNPPHVFGLFYYGQGMVQVPAFNGFRCIQNNIHRLPTVQTSDFGDASYQFDINAPPNVITAGTTWNFQFFYRDPTIGTRANYSDALSVIFCVH
jgi:glucose/arabinose dehydrogenase